MPVCRVDRSDFEKCPYDAYIQDPELERATKGSLMGSLIRMVGGYLKRKPNWSRTRIAAHSTPGGWLEFGWAHLARTKAAELFSEIAKQLPDLARQAWGDEQAAKMRDKAWLVSQLKAASGTGRVPPELNWLIAGWHKISQLGAVQDLYLRLWFDDFVKPVLRWMDKNNYKHGTTLSAGVRLHNSSVDWFEHLQRRTREQGEGSGTLMAVSDYAKWRTPKMTKSKDRKDRMKAIYDKEFGDISRIGRVSPDQISWSEFGGLPTLREKDSGLIPPSDVPVLLPLRDWRVLAVAGVVVGLGIGAYYLWLREPKKGKKRRRRRWWRL